ncbi:MAG: xanthine dehydrogenase accessory protein XdhC [Deltaproteobacteria bacterium]|nr:xanthine dehydrogenase accessory protein XdhC [Deltaproteobacteria bacterium]
MWNWIDSVAASSTSGDPAVLVTIVRCRGSAPCAPGARLLLHSDDRFDGTVGGGHLEAHVLADARDCRTAGTPRYVEYLLCPKTGQCCGGAVDAFFEVLHGGPQLYLFGAGHVGQALCRTLVDTPFSIHVIDDRVEWIDAPGLPTAVTRHRAGWEAFVTTARWSEHGTYIAIMTHSHDLDAEILAAVCERAATFIGLIGSRHKWFELQLRLQRRGLTADQLARVHCPIGAPTGKAPQEVAVSIGAELLRQHYATRTHTASHHSTLRREIHADGTAEGINAVPRPAVAE